MDSQENNSKEHQENNSKEPKENITTKKTFSPEEIQDSITKSCNILTENIKLLKEAASVQAIFSEAKYRNAILRIASQYFGLKGCSNQARIKLRYAHVRIILDSAFIPLAVKIFKHGSDIGLPNKFLLEDGKINDVYKPTRHTLSFLFNYSDHSEEFANTLAKESIFIDTLIKYHQELRHDFVQKKLKQDMHSMLRMTISCPYNLMMHENSETINLIRESNMIETVKPYLSNTEDDHFVMTVLFFLAYCVDETEAKLFLSERKTIDYFIKMLNISLSDEYKRARGFSSTELARGLERLAKNDTNKKQLVEQGVLNVLIKMARSDSPRECELAYLIVWTLAFDDSNKEPIKKEMDNLLLKSPCSERKFTIEEDEAQDTFNETVQRAERAREGCLFVLDDEKNPRIRSARARERPSPAQAHSFFSPPPAPPPGQVTSSIKSLSSAKSLDFKKQIMVSYSWSQKGIVLNIVNELKKRNMNVWVDVDNMGKSGNILDDMADAVESSDIIVIAMSQNYKTGQNTRSEAEYAYKQKKKIVPILVEPKYRPDGWLGIVASNSLYYDFTGKYPFEVKLAELLKALENQDEVDANIVPVAHTSPISDLSNSFDNSSISKIADIESWTNAQVKTWIKQNEIPEMQHTNISGNHLVFLKQVQKESPEFFYRCLENKLNLTSLDSLMKFSNALRKL